MSLAGDRPTGVTGALLLALKSIVLLDFRFLIGTNFGGGIFIRSSGSHFLSAVVPPDVAVAGLLLK